MSLSYTSRPLICSPEGHIPYTMDGLAIERAALAAKADSAKNSIHIQPEDRQPNESLCRTKGAGPPIVVPMSRGGMRGRMRGGRRGLGVNNQGHWPQRYWRTQDNQPYYGGPSSSWPNSQSANGGVFYPPPSYHWHKSAPDGVSGPGIANCDMPSSSHLPNRRGRPLPLPARQCQDTNRSDAVEQTISVDMVDKPYSNNLPALKPRPAFSGFVAMRTSKPASATPTSCLPGGLTERHEEIESPRSSLERDRERSSSPKRRKVDNPQPTLISNTIWEGVSSNDFAQTIQSPELRILDEDITTDTNTLAYPVATPTQVLVSPSNIKREPESPPPLFEERKIVTTYVSRFPLPENCQKTDPQQKANRMAFTKEKMRELREKGLELIGHCITRDDGICIEWKSSFPLWSDTLEPISEKRSPDPGGSRFSTPKNPTTPESSHVDDVMRPSPVFPSKSPTRVPQHAFTPNDRSVATVSPSPSRSDASRQPHRSHIPRGSFDLATAIEMSQRINATPSRPQSNRSLRSSSATFCSPRAATTQSYSTIPPSYPAATSPSTNQSRNKHGDSNQREASRGKGDVDVSEAPKRMRSKEAVKAGWTVIEDSSQRSDPRGSVEAENDFDELVEDKGMRVDEELDQVAPANLSKNDTGEDDDTPTRNFINNYMQLFETDRGSLVSLYAPDAILRYRLFDSNSSPKGLSSFPFLTARGHRKISSSLLELDNVHFYQTADEDGKNKIDLEYHREQTRGDISLYVRSMMTVDEDSEVSGTDENQVRQQHKHLVDHDFWLCKDECAGLGNAITEGHCPFLIRSHLIIMQEPPP